MSPPNELSGLSRTELEALVVRLLGELSELKQVVTAQREEIARLKGLKGRPSIKPSGMDKGTDGKPGGKRAKRRGRGKVTPRVAPKTEVLCMAPAPGSRFKGYEPYLVQDLVLTARVVRYRRERWLTPAGETVVAPLPGGVRGHFGPELRRFVLMQHHQGQVTVERLVTLLQTIGISISKRQVMRLLIDGQDAFLTENREVLRAGLQTAAWISVDDTGARHRGANGVCTQIGNDHFAWFGTTRSKSRLNFLDLLRAGHTDYVINNAALAYMRDRALAGPVIRQLAAHPKRQFADDAAWQRHLEALGIAALKVTPDPVCIATEGALWGSIQAHGFLYNAVVVSDDAGQFDIGEHALCWVHAERLVHKLATFTDPHRIAQEHIRGLIWWYYADLKAYRAEPKPRRRRELRARFDRIFQRRTGFVTLDRLLQRLHANKPELLRVLDRPEIPLHTNGSENDIRCQVTKRQISGGTKSDTGRDCRDAFLALCKTCRKLGIAFWDYLGARLALPNSPDVPYLPQIVRCRAQPA
ncbi:MAG TPA: transposase [Stellaceae bacterium]